MVDTLQKILRVYSVTVKIYYITVLGLLEFNFLKI